MQYSSVKDNEEDTESVFSEPSPKDHVRIRRKRYIFVFGTVLLLLIASSLFLVFNGTTSMFSSRLSWTNCGHSPAEAKQRGCQYDVMIGSWLLPECFDGELMEEYLSTRDWEFYSDAELTKELSMDMLRLGNHDFVVYATVHQHQHHCAYVWMKQFRAAVRNQKMDDLSANIHHTTHCAEALYTGMPGANGSLGLEVKYFSCTEPGLGNLSRQEG